MKLIASTTLALMIAVVSTTAGHAANPRGDVFSRSTKKTVNQMPGFDNPTQWFEALDDQVAKLRPTAADDAILSRPFNQDPNRVEEWSQTAHKVAKNYRQLAKSIRSMSAPKGSSDLTKYRSLAADWYDDAALLFEEMIKPRPPASTMEELEAQLGDIQKRAQALGNSNVNIHQLDMSLRKTYKVHRPHYDDPLHKFVSTK